MCLTADWLIAPVLLSELRRRGIPKNTRLVKMNLSYLVACGLLVTLLSVRIGAKPLSQAQQKVRGAHLHPFLITPSPVLILPLCTLNNTEICFRSEYLVCIPAYFSYISQFQSCLATQLIPHHPSTCQLERLSAMKPYKHAL